MTRDPSPCRCWNQALGGLLHEGHCCFGGPPEAYLAGDDGVAPCGHQDPRATQGAA